MIILGANLLEKLVNMEKGNRLLERKKMDDLFLFLVSKREDE